MRLIEIIIGFIKEVFKMIPKIIHYVWLGGGKLTPSAKKCIASWKRFMPDYEIKCWNESNFDLNSVPWTKEAVENKKWSLASDYIRHYELYKWGGVYMDTDVEIFKPLDEFLKYDFFTSVEFHPALYNRYGRNQIDKNGNKFPQYDSVGGLGLLAALIGASKENKFIKECMDFFGERHFINPDGTLFQDLINPAIMANILEKYGFKFINQEQTLPDNMKVFDASVFAGNIATKTKDSYAMHWCDSSWRDNLSLKEKVIRFLKTRFPGIYKEIILGK